MNKSQRQKNKKRPSWDRYFMDIVEKVATRSTCLRRQVGAIIVKDKHILSTGYNGTASGLEHCISIGCLREKLNIPSGERQEICRGLHAEQNAIIQAALHGVSVKGATLYTSHKPCITCAKMIINAKIKKIYYSEGYQDKLADDILKEAEIIVKNWKRGSKDELS